LGLGLLGLETVLNVLALGLAPVALVQPLGTLSLVAVVLLGVREGRAHQLTRRVVAGIALTVVSVALFVGLSSPWSTPPEAAPAQILHLAFLLVSFSVLACAVTLSPLGHLVRIVCAGVVFGSVAAGAHVLVHEVRAGSFSTVHGVLLVALVVGSVAGMWVVQTAYRSGPPETVLAGLTVIDPLVAVGIGALLLGEYDELPTVVLCALVAAPATATAGIGLLVRAHPAVRSASAAPTTPTIPTTPAPHGAILTNRRS
jgi:drug/metabolite transporter (DMT)-like permease